MASALLLSAWGPAKPALTPPQEPTEAFPWRQPLRGVVFEFALGPRLHQGTIRTPEALEPISAAWRIVRRIPDATAPQRPQLLGRSPAVLMRWGANPPETFHIAGRNQLHSKRWGRLILDPKWFRAVEAWATQQEATRIRLGVENPFPVDRVESQQRFRSLRRLRWARATMQGPEGPVLWEGPESLADLQAAFRGFYVPRSEALGTPWGHTLRVEDFQGESAIFELRDGSQEATRPLHATLLVHDRWGPVWVDDVLRDVWLDGYTLVNPLRTIAASERDRERALAQAALRTLAQGPPRPALVRTMEWDGEREVWVPLMRAVSRSVWQSPWRQMWNTASLDPLGLTEDQQSSAWDALAPTSPILLWYGPSGRRWTLFGEATVGYRLGPDWKVTLREDPWERIQLGW